MYKQKKPTMYPPWNTTFDAHVHRGRIMHVMVKDRTVELKSEATVALDSLATRCKKENGKLEIWVSGCSFGYSCKNKSTLVKVKSRKVHVLKCTTTAVNVTIHLLIIEQK